MSTAQIIQFPANPNTAFHAVAAKRRRGKLPVYDTLYYLDHLPKHEAERMRMAVRHAYERWLVTQQPANAV